MWRFKLFWVEIIDERGKKINEVHFGTRSFVDYECHLANELYLEAAMLKDETVEILQKRRSKFGLLKDNPLSSVYWELKLLWKV